MNALKQILIVDGDAVTRGDLGREVGRLGYSVSYAATAEAASLALSRSSRTEVVLIAVDLPDGHGQDLVLRLRRRGVMLPMILIAEAASEDDIVRGLDSGADDYIVRPLRLRELAARIRAQLRLTVSREEDDLQVGVLTYRPSIRTAFHPFLSQPARLTEKEAALLARLCRAEGRPVSRETLLREVWGYNPNVSSHTVETHIYRLRRKIEGGEGAPPIVLNEEGGYRLATIEPEPEVVARPERPGWAGPKVHGPLLVLAAVGR